MGIINEKDASNTMFQKKKSASHDLNPEVNSESVDALKKRIKELEEENESIKDKL